MRLLDGATSRPDFVLGNKHGKTCHQELIDNVAGWLREMGYSVQLNHPYSGAYIVNTYGHPDQQRHSLQIEVKRNLYMNEETRERTPGFEVLKTNLGRLIEKIVVDTKKQL